MSNKKAFTLLELLIVIVLAMIVFSVGGAVFINNIKSLIFFSSDLTQESHQIGFINQLTSQLYSKYEKRDINIKIDEKRISFYTGYPIFYEGFVRAEYIIEKDENNNFKKVYYEEFPYIDGNLGFEGLKKSFIGKFKNVKISVYENGRWFVNYKGKNFPKVVKLELDNNAYYITVNAEKKR